MKQPSLLIIFLTVFIDLIGFGIVMPLLPRYTEKFGAEGFQIGLVISSFSLMQFFFAPMWGRLSDRIGRRPVLLLSNAGSAISYAVFALASGIQGEKGLWILLASRVFAGICGANISVASAYIADITTPENRSKGMGMIGMAFGLGFILGPAIGSIAAWYGLAAPGWVAAGFCTLNFVLGCFILVESRRPNAQPTVSRPKFAQWRHTMRNPALALLILLFFLATFCFTCFETTLPLLLGSAKLHPHNLKDPTRLLKVLKEGVDPVSQHLRGLLAGGRIDLPPSADTPEALVQSLNQLIAQPGFYHAPAFTQVALPSRLQAELSKSLQGDAVSHVNRQLLQQAYPEMLQAPRFYFDEGRVGFLFAYCGVLAAFVQGRAIGGLVKRFGEVKLIWMSLIVVSLSLLLIPLAGGLVSLLFALGVFAIGSGVNRAPTMGLISSNSPADEQGANLGVAQSVGALARILGPLLATTLYARSVALPYFLCAGIALAAGVVAWMRLRPAVKAS
ncbi:MAG: MFS transporter [Verrucomicrobiales bacterium]|nr:MFS transporter [Verrucomicrobiales bacterium]